MYIYREREMYIYIYIHHTYIKAAMGSMMPKLLELCHPDWPAYPSVVMLLCLFYVL